ncbi:LLM class flavin-dependent oxidoreductase [Dactylosporangium sp. CS-047395]|uniref:LLM class flavin-dependent oxidoreductase n=1 Tax=Dactylosporangium sp. CS-047395 TaxID=3239936 RepID=UPI003D8CD18C
MTDYGHPITFGLSLDPAADRLPETRRLARAAQAHGLDYLAVQDHPYQPGHLDAWTLISHLAAHTETVTFVTDVADLQLRPPAMLAKAAASLSVLTGGRVTLGVGGGASTDAIAAMGGARRSRGDMVTYTAEALQVMRAALAGQGVRLASEQHTIEGYDGGPLPPRPVPLWLGSQGPRMLAVTGALSDGWISPLNIYVPPAEVPAKQRRIDEAALAAGRRPSDVRRVYNVIGPLADAAHLTEWALELGFDTFVFWPTDAPRRQLDRFAAEVVPAVRAAVEAGR